MFVEIKNQCLIFYLESAAAAKFVAKSNQCATDAAERLVGALGLAILNLDGPLQNGGTDCHLINVNLVVLKIYQGEIE